MPKILLLEDALIVELDAKPVMLLTHTQIVHLAHQAINTTKLQNNVYLVDLIVIPVK